MAGALIAAVVRAPPASAGDMPAAIARCAAIVSPPERLTCYDGVAAVLRGGAPDGTAAAPLPPVRPDRPGPLAVPPPREAPAGFRVALGYGYGIGDHAGSFRLLGGRIDLDSAAGSAGGITTAQAWIDNWPLSGWAIGGEYLRVSRTDKLRAAFPGGISILTDPVTGTAGVRLTADFGMLDIAYRPALPGRVHPSVGAGLGIGWGELSAQYDLYNDFIGTLRGSSTSKSPIGAVQGFVAIDFDLPAGLYASIVPRAVWVTGHPVGANQQYLDFSMSGLIGLRF